MATTTFACNKDARIALAGAVSLGAGASDYLPVGLHGGYLYRSLFGFSYSFAGMTTITSAILKVKTSSQYYVGFGSDPDINIYRIVEAWSEGSSVGLSGTNAVEWDNQPTIDSTVLAGPHDVATSENTWDSFDVTALLQAALTAGVFYGLRMRATDEGTATDVTEFYAREYGSNDAYIDVTYTTSAVPLAPTLVAPASNATARSRVPTFTLVHNDPNPCTMYEIEVNASATGVGAVLWDSGAQTSGIIGNDITRVYAGSALANGTAYYWRARTSDATGWGPWTGWRKFTTVVLPTVTLTQPAASGILGKMSYTAGAGWTTPRLNVGWTFACGDGGTQTHYEVEVGTSAAGAQLVNTGFVASAAASLVCSAVFTEAQRVFVRVQVRCSHGETSAWSSEFQVATRWGMARFFKDMASVPTSWSTSGLVSAVSGSSAIAVEYAASASSVALTAGYKATLAEVVKAQFFHLRVWLMAWGSAAPPSPSLDAIRLNYGANVIIPDGWTLPVGGSVDGATRVYGTQSLRIDGTGVSTDRRAYQLIPIEPNTLYTVQGRIKTLGPAAARILVSGSVAPSGIVFATDTVNDSPDWKRFTFQFNSLADNEIYVHCQVRGAAGTSAWFDALKVEASSVATQWTPGFLGDGVVLDAGGLQVDASNGGIFRLRGSTGGLRDSVEIGAKGLVLGGDVTLYSDTTNVLRTDDDLIVALRLSVGTVDRASGQINLLAAIASDAGIGFGTDVNLYRSAANVLRTDDTLSIGTGGFLRTGSSSFPASPSEDDLYYHTTYEMWFQWRSVRWVCTCFHELPLGMMVTTTLPLTATASNRFGVALPVVAGLDILIDGYDCFFTLAAGTALSATHKWVGTISERPAGTIIGTINIDSGASNTWRNAVDSADDAVDLTASQFGLILTWDKTGTPGNLTQAVLVRFRYIGV